MADANSLATTTDTGVTGHNSVEMVDLPAIDTFPNISAALDALERIHLAEGGEEPAFVKRVVAILADTIYTTQKAESSIETAQPDTDLDACKTITELRSLLVSRQVYDLKQRTTFAVKPHLLEVMRFRACPAGLVTLSTFSNFEKDKWIVAPGATTNIVNNLQWFTDYEMFTGRTHGGTLASGKEVKIIGHGNAKFYLVDADLRVAKLIVENALYAPDASFDMVALKAPDHNVYQKYHLLHDDDGLFLAGSHQDEAFENTKVGEVNVKDGNLVLEASDRAGVAHVWANEVVESEMFANNENTDWAGEFTV